MPTSYPGSLDAFTNPNSGDALTSPSHAGQHTDINDAIEAVEAAIGVKYGARVHAKRAASQTITTATNTAIALNETDVYDTDNFHETVTNPSRVTIPTAMGGIYLLVGFVTFAASATGNRIIFLRSGGATSLAGEATAGTATNGTQMNVSDVRSLAAAEYVELMVYQSSGGDLGVTASYLVAIKIA